MGTAMRIQHTVFIDIPIEDVFKYVNTYENETAWQSSVIEAYLTSEGPMGLGTTGREVRIFLGQRFESEWVVTEYEPPRKGTFESTSGPVPYIGTYSLEESDGGTRFSYHLETKPSGLLKLLKPITKGIYMRGLRADLAALKRILEDDLSE
jgi:uncharacterized protein YndB with AHSA1/START domain